MDVSKLTDAELALDIRRLMRRGIEIRDNQGRVTRIERTPEDKRQLDKLATALMKRAEPHVVGLARRINNGTTPLAELKADIRSNVWRCLQTMRLVLFTEDWNISTLVRSDYVGSEVKSRRFDARVNGHGMFSDAIVANLITIETHIENGEHSSRRIAALIEQARNDQRTAADDDELREVGERLEDEFGRVSPEMVAAYRKRRLIVPGDAPDPLTGEATWEGIAGDAVTDDLPTPVEALLPRLFGTLTPREAQVMTLSATDLSQTEIGTALGISTERVKELRASARTKLRALGRTQVEALIGWAYSEFDVHEGVLQP